MKKNIIICPKTIFTVFIVSFLWGCNAATPQQSIVSQTFSPTLTTTATSTQIPETLTPSNTPSPTITPTLTSTPVPALVSHDWAASEELITFGTFSGDGVCGGFHLELKLLSDGKIFFWKKIDQDSWSFQTATLSRRDTCKLLNSVDQAGFFDYDPSTYNNKSMGGGSTIISVQAWRSKSIKLNALTSSIYDYESGCKDCKYFAFPTLLPALLNTYHLLVSYQPENSKPYKIERVGVWVYLFSGELTKTIPWPITSKKLSEAVSSTDIGKGPNLILEGEDAVTVYRLFNQNNNLCDEYVLFTEKNQTYSISIHDLLPDEYPSTTPIPRIISCSPADGVIAIP